ncbi:MAG: galactose-1-phosphate uridylyltransferase, partial [Firmicutes bacterium]|nr:galactose-1-phosphate uridylyltransferase [Bacillota bacterium]
NKFPSLQPQPPEPDVEGTELTPVEPAKGECEVVLYSPRHDGTLADESVRHIRNLIRVWKDRYQELGSREEIQYVLIFENKGEAVGVTLHHPHGQIYAFPFIPPVQQHELNALAAHREKTGRCLICDLVTQEIVDGRRIVAESGHFAAAIPFYARYPYEVHIFAKEHKPSLLALDAQEEWDLARILKLVMVKYDHLFGFSLPYLMTLHQAPTGGEHEGLGHFRIEFYPPHRSANKLKYLAGCESGAGSFINDSAPEAKAEELRAAGPKTVEEIDD